MPGKIIELSLKSIRVTENGIKDENAVGRNVLSVSLIYPSPEHPEITTLKQLSLKDGKKLDFGLKKYTYADRILFKEEVYGQTLLIAQVTNTTRSNKFEKLLGNIFGSLLKTSWGLISGSIGNVAVGFVADRISAAHIDSFKELKDQHVDIIGRMHHTISMDDLPDVGGDMTIVERLVVPRNVTTSQLAFPNPADSPVRVDETLLKAGQANGGIEITLKVVHSF